MRDPVRYRDRSIGNEMNSRHCFFFAFAFSLVVALTASPVHAQTRVGEAAVVKNEVVRVAASATTQINVGDGLLRDEKNNPRNDGGARGRMTENRR